MLIIIIIKEKVTGLFLLYLCNDSVNRMSRFEIFLIISDVALDIWPYLCWSLRLKFLSAVYRARQWRIHGLSHFHDYLHFSSHPNTPPHPQITEFILVLKEILKYRIVLNSIRGTLIPVCPPPPIPAIVTECHRGCLRSSSPLPCYCIKLCQEKLYSTAYK
jgi:hypothetical protein